MCNNVAFHAVDLTRSRRNPLARRDLKRAIAAARPDVVHAHAGKAAALVATLALRCPTVGTVHGTKRDLAAYKRFTRVIGVSQGVIERLDHPARAVVYHGVAAHRNPAPSRAAQPSAGNSASIRADHSPSPLGDWCR